MVWRKVGATLAATAFAAGLSLVLADESPKPPVFTGLVPGVAAGGYDVVAYFDRKAAVPGRADITASYDGATWRFATAQNRNAFVAEPGRYAPKYGGYCAFAVANGYTAKGDPEQWSVIDGKLYFNYDAPTKAMWLKDPAGYIAKSEKNWPGVLQK